MKERYRPWVQTGKLANRGRQRQADQLMAVRWGWQGGWFEANSLELLRPLTPVWAGSLKSLGCREPAISAEP